MFLMSDATRLEARRAPRNPAQSVTRTPSTVPVTMIKAQLAAAPAKVAVVASKAADAAKFAGVAAASLAVAFQASAVTIKMGADNGGLVFEPSSVSVKAGETITFVNNAGFPHNVVFDEDAVPAGVNADKISHEDYFNAPGETYELKLDKAGSYGYYCEPHQGAGMTGKITVN